jgi:hypothetical protein
MTQNCENRESDLDHHFILIFIAGFTLRMSCFENVSVHFTIYICVAIQLAFFDHHLHSGGVKSESYLRIYLVILCINNKLIKFNLILFKLIYLIYQIKKIKS